MCERMRVCARVRVCVLEVLHFKTLTKLPPHPCLYNERIFKVKRVRPCECVRACVSVGRVRIPRPPPRVTPALVVSVANHLLYSVILTMSVVQDYNDGLLS